MIETIPAYEREPYRQSQDARVAEVRSAAIVLDDTLLFPEGGGQPCDLGTLTSPRGEAIEVRSVRAADGRVEHQPLANEKNLEQVFGTGDPVTVELDWARRYDHMQQHTAQHLLSAVAEDRFGWRTTSFHLGGERCDIELDAPALAGASLAQLEELVNQRIRQALPVATRRVTLEEYERLTAAAALRSRGLPAGHRGSVRLVEIADVDLNTCGGTHVASTAELQMIQLLDTEPMRGGTRLHWLAGDRVRQQFALRESRLAQLRRLFETGDPELVEVAQQRLAAAEAARKMARGLERELAELWTDKLASLAAAAQDSPDVVEAHFEGRPMSFLSGVARGLRDRLGDQNEATCARLALLTGSDGDKSPFVLVQLRDDVDLEALGKSLVDVVGGRGGGRAPFFQGAADSWSERSVLITRWIESLH
jgi:Ser-tRNA(Ala) deacylase AlaX